MVATEEGVSVSDGARHDDDRVMGDEMVCNLKMDTGHKRWGSKEQMKTQTYGMKNK